MLGCATVIEASGHGRTALRWCATAPLLLAMVPLLLPGQLWALVTSGLGGGAVGVALAGLAGGHALAGRVTWLRWLDGLLALLVIVGLAGATPGMSGHAVTSPRGAWLVTLVTSLMLTLMLAAAIPFRRLNARGAG